MAKLSYPCKIYGLYDPSDPRELTRYVGKCTRLRRRLYGHIYEGKKGPWKNHRHFWIRSLLHRGVVPQIRVLEIVVPGKDWQERERFWIASFPKGQLVNSTSGGDGTPDLAPASKARIGAASKVRMLGNTIRKGVKLTKEECKLISDGMAASEKVAAEWLRRKGKPSYVRTPETRKKNSITSTGKSRPDVSLRLKKFPLVLKGTRVWITNGVQNKRWLKTRHIPIGWRAGITIRNHHLRGKTNPTFSYALKKLAKKRRGKMRWITDGVKSKNWMPGDVVPEGLKFGRAITWKFDKSKPK